MTAPGTVTSWGPQEILSEIVQLLLGESISGKAQLQNRHGRSAIVNDQRRQGPGRQESQDGLGSRRHLCIRGVQTRPVLQVNLDDGLTIYRS